MYTFLLSIPAVLSPLSFAFIVQFLLPIGFIANFPIYRQNAFIFEGVFCVCLNLLLLSSLHIYTVVPLYVCVSMILDFNPTRNLFNVQVRHLS